MNEGIVYLLTGVLGLNVFAMLGVAFQAGKVVQRVKHLERKVDNLVEKCPYCKPGAAA